MNRLDSPEVRCVSSLIVRFALALICELTPRLSAAHAKRLVWGACVLIACSSAESPTAHRQEVGQPKATAAETLTAAEVARPAFCDRPGVRERATAIDALFCSEPGGPAIASLRDLQELLDLVPFAPAADGGASELVMLGHSTSLPGHLVSPINPRAFILGKDNMLAYARGGQEVELVSRASDGTLVFYLLLYQQACNQTPEGCSFGELYTQVTEAGWTQLRVQDDSELENTPFDCRACHARGTERATLLMREVDGPWTHFFDTLDPGSNAGPELKGYHLLQDYLAAKGDELYAGIDVTRLKPSTAQALEIVVGLAQPVYFDSLAIELERWPRGPNGYAAEPRRSPTWQAAYDAWKRGEQLALPHYEPRPTSNDKQARLTEAYARYRRDQLGLHELPDLSDIFPDDPATRAEIGLEVEPDASPVALLIQACGPCHNDVLDQDISRAAFNIDLARMSDDELDIAIERIELPRTAAGAMPPLRARVLSARARERLVDYLRAEARTGEIDPQLTHAAAMGMRGGSRPSRR
jgi:hypothetical protein